MRTWVKVLLGLGAGLLLLVAVAATLLVRSNRWGELKQLGGGVAELTRSSRELEQLQKAKPFDPPADGRIPEPRLLDYLAVCEALQPEVKPYQAWMEAHAGSQGDLRDAAEIVELLARVTAKASRQLRARDMAPQELAWLHRQVDRAMKELQRREGGGDLALAEGLRRAVADPGISPRLREDLQGLLRRQEATPARAVEPLSPNAELCARHAGRIRAADLGEFSALLLEGLGKGRHGRKTG